MEAAKTYRWNLLGQINLLRKSHIALLQRTTEIDLFYLIAEVDLPIQDRNQAILDY